MVSGRRDYWAGYYTPDEMTALASDVQGQFGGIGVRVSEDRDDYLLVANVIAGYAADRAGPSTAWGRPAPARWARLPGRVSPFRPRRPR